MPKPSFPSEPRHRRRMAPALVIGVASLLLGLSTPVLSRDDAFAGRPGLAEAESEPAAIAKCESLHASLAGFRPPQRRVDLWVSGQLRTRP